MVENRPVLNFLSHLVMIVGVVVVVFPVYLAFIASTRGPNDFYSGVVPLLPGPHMIENYWAMLTNGMSTSGAPPIGPMMLNSLIMAVGVAVGKIAISILSAFAIVYFRFPLRTLAFWLIFITLMLPVEVRIVPTFKVVADLGLLNNYGGLIVPLLASATATFLFRQFFLTVPEELMEAARVDGAGHGQIFFRIILPLSMPIIASFAIFEFIWVWNDLLVATIFAPTSSLPMTQTLNSLSGSWGDRWYLQSAGAFLVLIVPLVVFFALQRFFVRGLMAGATKG